MPGRSVAIVIQDGVQALDVAGPVDVFAEANGLLGGPAFYRTVLVARTRDVIVASNGMRLLADLGFAEARIRSRSCSWPAGPSCRCRRRTKSSRPG